MDEPFEFTLVRAAKSKGGDLYQTPLDTVGSVWKIYIPQVFSRSSEFPRYGTPLPRIYITLKEAEEE